MSLLLAWNFAEASGPVLDVSGNGRGFTLTGSSTRTSAGGGYTYGGTQPNTKGLTETGADVQVGPSLTGLQTTARTVMFWAKLSNADPCWLMEFHRTAEDTGVWGFLYLSSSLRGRAKNSSNTAFEQALTPDVGNYHHLALTHDGTTLKAYRDGSLVGSGTSMAFPVWDGNTFRVLDGAQDAVISEVRMYDEVLDAATIAALKDTPVTESGELVEGTALISSGAVISGTGKRRVHGTASISAGAAVTAAGKRKVHGATAVTAGATVAGSGKRLVHGATSVASGLSVAASGNRTVHGSAVVSTALVISGESPVPSTGLPGRIGDLSPEVDGGVVTPGTFELGGTIR